MSEKEKMISSLPYRSSDEQLSNDRQIAKELLFEYNNSHPSEYEKRNNILNKLIGHINNYAYLEPPFRCDYGYNISFGDYFYANYNLIVLDCAKVTIGNSVMFGPNVCLCTAGHPLHHEIRNQGIEYAFPITIGNNVWIGAGVIVNPGITIGDNVVIGSGSIVTKDIPSNTIAVGNPCKVVREITEEDKQYYFKDYKL